MDVVRVSQICKCFNWVWSLSVDMQLYILSPLLIAYLHKGFQYWVITLVMSLSCVIAGYVSFVNDLPTAVIMDFGSPRNDAFFYYYIDMPWCRLNPFIIGIITGYVLRTHTSMLSNKVLALTGWCVSGVLLAGVLFLHDPNHVSSLGNAVYNSLNRTLWSLGIAGIVILCSTGHGGTVNSFLSSRLFVMLSRLCYCTFLVHFIVLHYFVGSLQHKIEFTFAFYMFTVIVTAVISFALAALMHVTVERPFMKLQKLMTESYQKREKLK